MTRNEIKQKIKEYLQKFDGIDAPDDMVSETLFNIYPRELNEICRLFEGEFRKLRQGAVSDSVCDCIETASYWMHEENNIERCMKCNKLKQTDLKLM